MPHSFFFFALNFSYQIEAVLTLQSFIVGPHTLNAGADIEYTLHAIRSDGTHRTSGGNIWRVALVDDETWVWHNRKNAFLLTC